MQQEIQESAYRAQKAIEACEQLVVGVNAHQVEEALELERLEVDPAVERSQRERLESLRAGRDAKKAAALLERLADAAAGEDNLMPLFIECVESGLTLGEICDALRAVWGEYRAGTTIL
jgi:methylmalonyl-CoA mutase N-terminal domain/subunit